MHGDETTAEDQRPTAPWRRNEYCRHLWIRCRRCAVRSCGANPPQDIAAEQCVLGAILLSKDAIAEVVESVRQNDFYKPAHQEIFSAAIDLYGRNEPVDAVTVADYLAKAGNLLRVGGAPYLHTLTSVPVAANAGYYARIVTEQAVLRRLVEAGTRIAQMGYAAEGEVDQLVDRAQAEVYDVTGERTAEDYQPLENLMQGAIEEIEAIDSRAVSSSASRLASPISIT